MSGSCYRGEKKRMASFLQLVNICDISAQLHFESDCRSRQSSSTGAAETPVVCASTNGKRVCGVCSKSGQKHRKKTRLNLVSAPHGVVRSGGSPTSYSIRRRGGRFFFNNTHIHTLWLQNRYVSTWTSIQLPCLCNVSFTEPGPLAYCGSDAVFVSGWKDGVEKHPPLERKESDLTHTPHFTTVYKSQ